MTAPTQQQPDAQADGDSGTVRVMDGSTYRLTQPDTEAVDPLAPITGERPRREDPQAEIAERYSYTHIPACGALARLTYEDVATDNGGDRRLTPAWRVKHLDRELPETIRAEADKHNMDPNVSPRGRKAKTTEATIAKAIPELRKLADEARVNREAIAAEMKSLVPTALVPAATERDERRDEMIWRRVATELDKLPASERATRVFRLCEDSPRIREALVRAEDAVLWGGSAGLQETIKATFKPVLDHQTSQHIEKLRGAVWVLERTEAHAERMRKNLLEQGDRGVLEAKGLIQPSIRHLSTAAKAKLASELGADGYRERWAQS